MHDPEMFPLPDEFRPERFLETTDPRLRDFELPFGFGRRICPGRHFAKQEILACIAVVTAAFEIELLDTPASMAAKPDMKYYMTGSCPPDRKIPARVRRRRMS